MTDESGQSYPATPNTLLDNALGAKGYYGAFTANLHTDNATTFESDQVLASARARGVPVVSATQLLRWLDGRSASSFASMDWTGNTLSFTVNVGSGANGLTAMLPTAGPAGTVLSTLTRAGSAVAFTRTTIKGLEYAMFPAAAGGYQATYAVAGSPAALTGFTASASPDGTAELGWKSSQPATTAVEIGATPREQTTTLRTGGMTTRHLATALNLTAGRTYYYRTVSIDAMNRRSVWPARNEPAATFTVPTADTRPPRVSAARAMPLPDGTATISWKTNEKSDSRVAFGTNPERLRAARYDTARVTSHAVVLTGLRPDRTYYYRVLSKDASGNRTAPTTRPHRFVSAAAGLAVHTAEQFRTGRLRGTTVLDSGFGALTLTGTRTAGSYRSPILDARQYVTWDRASWQAGVPTGATLKVWVRTGSRARPDQTWSSWQPIASSGSRIATNASRFLQYRLQLTSSANRTPVLTAIAFTHHGLPPSHPGETD